MKKFSLISLFFFLFISSFLRPFTGSHSVAGLGLAGVAIALLIVFREEAFCRKEPLDGKYFEKKAADLIGDVERVLSDDKRCGCTSRSKGLRARARKMAKESYGLYHDAKSLRLNEEDDLEESDGNLDNENQECEPNADKIDKEG